MGLKALAPAFAAIAFASPAAFLETHQLADGGFTERGGVASPALTAWATLGLAAAGRPPDGVLAYFRAHENESEEPATRALVALAAASLGDDRFARSLPTEPGSTNTVIWTILALRQAGLPAPKALVQALLLRQARSGGWGWAKGVAPDSNDTAAALQALKAAGVSGPPIARALAYLRSAQAPNGGFALVRGREPDAQSTAWAMQAFVAARAHVPAGALAYLNRLRRRDGSFRYSQRYVTTPVWVTAQVIPALHRKPFPLPAR